MMNKKVILLKSYSIFLDDFFTAFSHWLKEQSYTTVAFLIDEKVYQAWQEKLNQVIKETNAISILFEAGETHKHIATCENIWSQLLKNKVDRKGLLVNIGGGMTGDLGGFVAATFKRGIDFVQVPTTSLSMVDASIGGKVGINFSSIKNSIGVFCQPKAVFVDTSFLQSLSKREKISGLAEIIKHALIHDLKLWEKLKQLPDIPNTTDWDDIIYQGILVKQYFVEKDPFERDIRKALNFGHTIGHALESFYLASDTPLLHGEAVAMGMVAESYLSFLQNKITEEDLNEITNVISRFFLIEVKSIPSKDALIQLMENDKKNEGAINFSLIGPLGQCNINATGDTDTIFESIDYCMKNFSLS
ncbi:MAG: 3-dehydroquinate synthase [Saprospiraceae bacterium]|nr:3-dehydroquinate synthase [Saprospiraceae bacterium]